MSDDFTVLRRDVQLFLSSLRNSLERPFRAKFNEDREKLMRTLLLVEEARLRFQSIARFRPRVSPEEWDFARSELLKFLDDFFTAVDQNALDRPFRAIIPPRDREASALFKLVDKDTTIRDALDLFGSRIVESSITETPKHEALTLVNLEKIVPSQQIAPAQFEVADGKIRITKKVPKTFPEDQGNITSALEHIRNSGERLIENIENSNCDKRLLDSIKDLQSQIVENGNIVKIGLTNMACNIMGTQFKPELPDAIYAMLNSYSSSISLYIAQFPEWEQFSQKAVQLELDDDDLSDIGNAADEIINALSSNPGLAEPDVPKTIAFVRQFLASPAGSARRAAFAMLRTIENLVSSILRHSLDLASKTTDKFVDGLSSAAAKVMIGLLGIALIGASGIGSAAMRAGAPWVKQAAEIVQKQIDKAAE